MKKGSLLIVLTFMIMLTGCGKEKKVLCTMNKEFEVGYKLEAKVTGELEKDIVNQAKLKITMNFDDEKLAESTYQILLEENEDDSDIQLHKNVITITSKIEQTENQTKQDFIDAYQAEGYTCE